ncbi:MAG TPA: hypothetical protein VFN55_03645 [Solirubrobacteraceae bacterium]|nr:hypothetical protein [Solirubrobacteraceae bacterium]
MATERVHITLDLEIDGDRISGKAEVGDAEVACFLGWLGLISLLDRLVRPTAVRSSTIDPQR